MLLKFWRENASLFSKLRTISYRIPKACVTCELIKIVYEIQL